ncbi:hypothetical protein EDEG_01833 [Edhazardia aedis USNM 41457]|uniref:C2H2-type domain-containing protein n=1 Tax=Edhazardia aedis (strain USNM 41457) TaxID=1003232 RepID=J9DMT2_EDHAE|nr:hypothetical protein EDEG_01833 [Edhazardia aedis USNM 41457]|eukprot:EJW03880.1 hypothetical protein EDEG_01833 [Edhazardia aedis USNM 41457]
MPLIVKSNEKQRNIYNFNNITSNNQNSSSYQTKDFITYPYDKKNFKASNKNERSFKFADNKRNQYFSLSPFNSKHNEDVTNNDEILRYKNWIKNIYNTKSSHSNGPRKNDTQISVKFNEIKNNHNNKSNTINNLYIPPRINDEPNGLMFNKPKENDIKHTVKKNFICKIPKCNKSYTSAYGLKYHEIHGHNKIIDINKPFKCTFEDCEKRYKNSNGLKYHLENGHRFNQ